MKRQVKYIARLASQIDTAASKIFTLTRLALSLALLASAALFAAAPLSADPITIRQLADGLFHASFRIAAVGAATGFAADIVIQRNRC